MKKFQIIREPIDLRVWEVIEIRENKDKISCERRLILDNNLEIWAKEDESQPFVVGDLIHYDVRRDDWQRFDRNMPLPPYSKLVELE